MKGVQRNAALGTGWEWREDRAPPVILVYSSYARDSLFVTWSMSFWFVMLASVMWCMLQLYLYTVLHEVHHAWPPTVVLQVSYSCMWLDLHMSLRLQKILCKTPQSSRVLRLPHKTHKVSKSSETPKDCQPQLSLLVSPHSKTSA